MIAIAGKYLVPNPDYVELVKAYIQQEKAESDAAAAANEINSMMEETGLDKSGKKREIKTVEV